MPRTTQGRAPSTQVPGGGGGGTVTTAAVNAASYDAWAAGTYPVNTFRSHDGKIAVVVNPAGTSAEPGAVTDSEWRIFDKQGDIEKTEYDYLS